MGLVKWMDVNNLILIDSYVNDPDKWMKGREIYEKGVEWGYDDGKKGVIVHGGNIWENKEPVISNETKWHERCYFALSIEKSGNQFYRNKNNLKNGFNTEDNGYYGKIIKKKGNEYRFFPGYQNHPVAWKGSFFLSEIEEGLVYQDVKTYDDLCVKPNGFKTIDKQISKIWVDKFQKSLYDIFLDIKTYKKSIDLKIDVKVDERFKGIKPK